MKPVTWGSFRWDDPNVRWGNPSYVLEPGDPDFTPPPEPTPVPKKTKTKRKYMASNSTPDRIDELIASGEDLCDGLNQHAVAIGIKQNTFLETRADLDGLIGKQNALKAAAGEEPEAYTALRTADSNGKGFIAAAVKVLSLSLGNDWSDAWQATGLPDNVVGVPRTQDKRFTALGGLKAYFAGHPEKEISTTEIVVTAALATTLHTAVSTARGGVGNALSKTASKMLLRDGAKEVFRRRFRGTVSEIEQLLEDEDPKWYDFGLNRPSDPAQPGAPLNVLTTALGSGRVLVQIDGAKRANSFNYYRKIVGTDSDPVKVINTAGTQHTLEGLPVGATVEVTVSGVNDAGEGPANDPVSVVVS